MARELAAEGATINLNASVTKPNLPHPAGVVSASNAGPAKPVESPQPSDKPADSPIPTRPLVQSDILVPKPETAPIVEKPLTPTDVVAVHPEPTPVAKPPFAPTLPIETPVAMQTKPISVIEDELEMPEAVSLAASDVAAARVAAREATPPPPAIEPSPHKPESKHGNRLHHRGRHGGKAPEAPKPDIEAESAKTAIVPEPSQPVAAPPAPRPVMVDSKPAPLSEVVPPAAVPMTGKLILPSAHKAVPTATAPLARPDKLAKGEVFVDSAGNVIIGE